MPYVSTKREWSNSFSFGLYPLTRGGRGGERDKIRNKNLNNNLNQNVNVTKRARFAILAVSILDNLHNIIYLIYTRENKLWEGVPVLHDNFLKSIWSSRACCCGYFCLLFPWPARPTFTWTRHVSPPSSWSMPAVKIISALGLLAVSYFSLQTYCTRAAKPLAARKDQSLNNNIVVCNRAGWDKN